jgi:redox-sensitive bicupin YhaK (pirin superfamily)
VSDNLGVRIRLIAGSGFCLKSPVPVLSPTLYADVHMQTATTLLIPDEHEERAVYVLEGEAQLEGEQLEVHSLVVLPAGQVMTLFAESDCHLVVLGGAPLDGPRRINWNFVASDPLKIEQARQRWAAGDWPTVPGETERIELPVR